MAQQHANHTDVLAAATGGLADDDCKLLQQVIQGDEAAFWRLWERYQHDSFFRQCLRWMGGNREDAEDALSGARLKAWQRLPASAHQITNLRGWLTRLLYNHCIDTRRAQQRRGQHVQGIEDIEAAASSAQESVEETIIRREMGLHIHDAINNLPSALREVSRLRFFHEMSHRDIAVRLNISPANARKRLQQARALLQAALTVYRSRGHRPAASATMPLGTTKKMTPRKEGKNAQPAPLTTTLYDLIVAIHTVVAPDHDEQVVAIVEHILRSGRIALAPPAEQEQHGAGTTRGTCG